MPTIALYANKINQMPGLIQDVKKSVVDYQSELSALKKQSLKINQSICNLSDVISSIQASSQTQEQKIASLETFQQNSEQFIEDTARIDREVADVINQRKDDFYEEYYYLKPECEKNGWEKFCDGVKAVGEWCKENWKSIAKIVLTVVIIAALGIASVLTGGTLAVILAGAFWGALAGGLIGGVMGGITSVLNGGSFLEGFADGALSGAVTGAITGAVCAGIGVAGQAFGNTLNAISKVGACATKFRKVIKVTSQVTKVISLGMDGFDMMAMGIGFFDPDNPLVQINQKLHSSAAYNLFQVGVNGLALFTGAASSTMKCFVAGTMVLTASGLVAIESIKAGDKVISTNAETFEVAEKRVLETYIRETTELVHLTISGELIKTTYDHPFYVKEHGFVSAGELYIGDKLLDLSGNMLIVEDRKVETLDEAVKVYNFQVEDFHTCHVSENCVLVHNANYDDIRPELPEFNGKTTEGVMVTPEGEQISFVSGNGNPPSYPQYKAQSASHVEGKAALYMRENGINEATIFHNNPNGTCGFCDRQVSALLPEGAKLTVVPPNNAVANNAKAVPIPKVYTGNATIPTVK